MIHQQKVNSSCMASVAYDDQKGALYIRFQSSAIYRYTGVPSADYDAFIAAHSKGRFFLSRIKGKFPPTRMRENRSKK